MGDGGVTSATAETELALALIIFFTGQLLPWLVRLPKIVLWQYEQRTMVKQQINVSTVTVALVGDSNDIPFN